MIICIIHRLCNRSQRDSLNVFIDASTLKFYDSEDARLISVGEPSSGGTKIL